MEVRGKEVKGREEEDKEKRKWERRGGDHQLPGNQTQCRQDTGSLVQEHKAAGGGK